MNAIQCKMAVKCLSMGMEGQLAVYSFLSSALYCHFYIDICPNFSPIHRWHFNWNLITEANVLIVAFILTCFGKLMSLYFFNAFFRTK